MTGRSSSNNGAQIRAHCSSDNGRDLGNPRERITTAQMEEIGATAA